jgi:hypothetical protein
LGELERPDKGEEGVTPPDRPAPPPEPGSDYKTDREDRPDSGERASARAGELQDSLPDGCRGRVTMAVGIGQDSQGSERTVVGTSEPGGYLRPGVELKPGEELARGNGHAEADVVSYMDANSIDTNNASIAAGRPICGDCADKIADSGARATTPLKET